MKVRAKEVGFDGLNLRQPGEVFEMPQGSDAPWFEVIEDVSKRSGSKKAVVPSDDIDAPLE
jgi:hypothetical protein